MLAPPRLSPGVMVRELPGKYKKHRRKRGVIGLVWLCHSGARRMARTRNPNIGTGLASGFRVRSL